MISRQIRQAIRDNRRSPFVRSIASGCEKFLRAWHNDGFFEFQSNGERFVLDTFASWWGPARPIEVWDVGAHLGEWAEEVHGRIPAAKVTSFEILPPIASGLTSRLGGQDWIDIKTLGLSDRAAQVEVTWNHEHDSTSAIAPRVGSRWFAGDAERVVCSVTTVDSLLATGAPPPGLLKIDTEGHEAEVLHGAAALLSGPHAPVLIQFEYGETWIPARSLLHDQQTMLEEFGYAVGRVYPNHVHFKRYDYSDEHFRMGNMVAVRDKELQRLLSH